MSAMANAMALRELSAAMNAIEAPHTLLPEVKDNNGVEITDVKDKRLFLARKHIQAAGDVVNALEQLEASLEAEMQGFLGQRFGSERGLKGLGFGVPNVCNCPACVDSPEPGRTMGFGSGIK